MIVISEEQKEHKRVVVLLALVAILLTIIVMLSIFYIRSTHSMSQAKREAVKIAQEHAQLDTVDNFYWYNRDETYFGLTGKDTAGKEIVIIIPEKGGDILTFAKEEGLSEGQANHVVKERYGETTIQKSNLGIFDGKAVWEVVCKTAEGSLNYYLIAFENGEEVNTVLNV
ncbi:cell wall elongation regulator TseB-like domain-containing protein [Enterococcus sp. BWR-S5]|uniref:cell wall elongation regulator TseB-like domain-containing protein n=1 Tax=Enterococcus sp. BWR-S5 TaxID=2787714 RepID=UPI001920DEB3|nr:DUF5590 domain-containing protein [Enterococcus sp. BWR-S5]